MKSLQYLFYYKFAELDFTAEQKKKKQIYVMEIRVYTENRYKLQGKELNGDTSVRR
jgi:hypothetical protein